VVVQILSPPPSVAAGHSVTVIRAPRCHAMVTRIFIYPRKRTPEAPTLNVPSINQTHVAVKIRCLLDCDRKIHFDVWVSRVAGRIDRCRARGQCLSRPGEVSRGLFGSRACRSRSRGSTAYTEPSCLRTAARDAGRNAYTSTNRASRTSRCS
jgi:hypothetical protein